MGSEKKTSMKFKPVHKINNLLEDVKGSITIRFQTLQRFQES